MSTASKPSGRRASPREEEDEDYQEEDEEISEDSGEFDDYKVPIKQSKKVKNTQKTPKPAAKRKLGTKRARKFDDEEMKAEDIDLEAEYDSEAEAEEGAFVLGAEDDEFHDFSGLKLKQDHANRPLWVCPDGRIFLETFSPVYKQAYDFLIAVAEPVSRPECIHEYILTPHSLYAAVSIGLETGTIISVLERLSKSLLPSEVKWFIRESTENYGKVKLVLKHNKFFVESPFPDVLQRLLKDETISSAKADSTLKTSDSHEFMVSKALRDKAVDTLTAVRDIDLTSTMVEADGEEHKARQEEPEHVVDPDKELHSFEIQASKVEHVKQRCLPGGLNYPMLEEYDFKGDTINPSLAIDLKPLVKHRPYQEKSLSKMFGNSRARSGIIVLPCGAGKSLVGVSAAARVKKSCLCLCTNAVSVDQWKYQFQLWTSLREDQICRFTADKHEWFAGSGAGVCITTYTMVAYSGRRSEESEQIMMEIMSREWGLILLDEVHVVPAQMFRRVLGIVKAHCKLGLTATLVREDQLITDLNFLIGPKLYEANWLDLTRAGHIANVQCAEVWCPMTAEFMREYLKKERTAGQRQLLYVMNPAKVRACQYLVQYHEGRGDKVIVFSDNLFALREYAVRMKKPFLYGGTGHQERTRVLHAFKTNPAVNTVFLSKVGDNSLDIPEANVLIQISSHAGSRRQEAQRLGRILRKKKTRKFGEEEFDAFFYTLVSTDTQEVYFTAKRQRFLIDQGYSYKVIPSLLDMVGGGEGLLLTSMDEQLNLLAAVLHASETDAQPEELPEAERDIVPGKGRKSIQARRALGSMAALSGGVGMKYLEYSTAATARRGGGGGGGGGSSGKLAKLRRHI